MTFIVLSSLKTVHDTLKYRYCIFSLLCRPLRIRLKRQESFTYILTRQRENVHCEGTIHFIITLFNISNVLLCIIYQLKFTVFMYVTRISRYM
jgi:hypothetical protein